MSNTSVKSLDHLVLPVGSLAIARKRLSRLGFTVAPTGTHPFGTENACVFFQDDTYLEPLAIGDPHVHAEEAGKGNRFVSRDRLYRQRNGDDGFSLVALGTDDAAGNAETIEKSGFDCGRMVAFDRKVELPNGKSSEISVRLLVATTESSPDFALFCCQWIRGRKFDDKFKAHANGALGIKVVTFVGADTDEFRNYLASVAGRSSNGNGCLNLENASLNLMTSSEYAEAYGIEPHNVHGKSKAVAFEILVNDLKSVKMVLFASGIVSNEIGHRLVVDPAKGQGYSLAFVERNGSKT